MSGEGAGSRLQVKKSGYRWMVKKDVFTRQALFTSPLFKFGLNDNQSWHLRLGYQDGSGDKKTYANLNLYLHANQPVGQEQYKFKLGLIAKNGKEMNVKCLSKIFPESTDLNDHCCTWDKFIALDSLLDEENGYFKDNRLTIFCILEVHRNLEIPASTLMNDLSKLMESGEFSDVTVVVGEEELKLHMNVLSSRSSVFKAMFQHEMKESQDGRLEIKDLDVIGVKGLIRFLYTGEVEGLSEIADKVLPAANKYGVERLKALCEQELCDKLDAENVTDLLKLADLHSAKYLKDQALGYIRVNSAKIVKQIGEWADTLTEANRALFKEVVCALAEKELIMENLNL